MEFARVEQFGPALRDVSRALVRPLIAACSEPGDLVLDPFVGSGTVCAAVAAPGRRWLGIELNAEYAALAWEAVRAAGKPSGKGR